VSEAIDRRAAQKARTREKLRVTAQSLFAAKGFEAVTINELAATAGVSVQTVFNHYAGKEDLFFTERAAWVEGPAAAVRDRHPDEAPKMALRRYLLASVEGYARAAGDPHHVRMIEVLEASPALLAHERGLHEEAVRLLGEALTDAWGCIDNEPGAACRTVLAEVTASVWLAAVRTILLDLRTAPPAPGDEDAIRAPVALLETVLASGLNFVQPQATGSACQVA
jgi:AcrR family transcriptional regulator